MTAAKPHPQPPNEMPETDELPSIDLRADELQLNALADSLIADAERRGQVRALKRLCLRVVKRIVYTQPDKQPDAPA